MLKSIRARLLAFFQDRCFEAPLRRDRHGFARVTLAHQGGYITLPAHRLAYSLFVAPVQTGEPVRHTCGHPACINPRHLYAVSLPLDRRIACGDCIGEGVCGLPVGSCEDSGAVSPAPTFEGGADHG